MIFFLCAVSLAFSAEVSGLAQEPADSRLPVNRIVATIRVGELPVSAVVSPNSKWVYVANVNSANVSVIDTATNNVTFSIPISGKPTALPITPDGSQLYVAFEAGVFYGGIALINTSTNTQTTMIAVGGSPTNLALSPNGTTLWVSDGDIVLVDTATNQVSGTIPTDSASPGELVFTPDGAYVYVLCGLDGTGYPCGLLQINTATEASVQLEWGNLTLASGLAITPNGKKLYFSDLPPNYNKHPHARQVSAFSIVTDKVEANVHLSYPGLVGLCAVTPNGKYVYFAETREIILLDVTTNKIVDTPIKTNFPAYLTIAPNGKYAYVLGANDVKVVDISPAE